MKDQNEVPQELTNTVNQETAKPKAQSKPKVVKPTWRLDKGARLLHIECAGYESYVHVFVNGKRVKQAVKLENGKKSIQLSGPLPADDLFIKVVKLKK